MLYYIIFPLLLDTILNGKEFMFYLKPLRNYLKMNLNSNKHLDVMRKI